MVCELRCLVRQGDLSKLIQVYNDKLYYEVEFIGENCLYLAIEYNHVHIVQWLYRTFYFFQYMILKNKRNLIEYAGQIRSDDVYEWLSNF